MDSTEKNKEAIFEMLDSLYKRLKTVDASAQQLDQGRKKSEIREAMLGYIASFGLSMLKDLYLRNTDSVGFLLSMRCIIEGLAVYLYTDKETITEQQEEIFKLQSYFIEKEIYERYSSLDGVIFDLKIIKDNFENTKQYIIDKYKYSSKQIRELLRSKVPFLGSIQSFEKLIKDNMSNDLLLLYKTLSLYAHPYDYRLNDPDFFANISIMIYRILDMVFKDIAPSEKGLEFEYNRVIGYNEFGLIAREKTHKQREKLNELCRMLDKNGFNFMAYSLETCGVVLFDYLLDIAFGYTEQSTTKWKTSIENLWMFNMCIDDDQTSRDNEIMHYHSQIKQAINFGKELTDSYFQPAYEIYLTKYKNGCTFEKFKKMFATTTGYTINEAGEISYLRTSIFDFIDIFSKNINGGKMECIVKQEPFSKITEQDYGNINEIEISPYLKMKYDESQAMSHASGYLYYCLSGAWYDGNLLAYLYDELLQVLLTKLHKRLQILYIENKIEKTMINFLRNFINENKDFIARKKQIYLMPKVKKNY